MSYLLELLGRGLGRDVGDVLDRYYWAPSLSSMGELHARAAKTDSTDVLLQIALGHLRGGQPAEGATVLERAVRAAPDSLPCRLALAAACAETGRVDQASEHLSHANLTHPGEAPVLFALGFCHERMQQRDEAEACYRDALEHDSSLIAARQRLAALAVHADRVGEAIEQYVTLREQDPQDVHLRTTLAHLYYRDGQYARAIEEFETAIALAPENWALVDDEVEVLVAAGQVREAIEKLHTLIEQQGPFADLQVRLGDLYSQVGDDAAALRHYHRALEIEPAYLEAKVKLGTHHLVFGRWDEAAESFHDAVELNDQLLTSYVGLAVSQSAAGRAEEAGNSLDLAAAVEPNSTVLLSEMARLQLKAAVADEFLRGFDADGPAAQAEVHLDNDDLLQKQLERHEDEVRRHRGHADVHYRYGVLLRAEGRLGEALEQFTQAVEINPSYVKAIIKMGITQQELGRTVEAIETLHRALDIEPYYVDLHYRLGLLYTDRHEFDKALEHMEAAAEGAQDNEQIRATLALALQNMGLMDRAAATWRSLWKMHHAAT